METKPFRARLEPAGIAFDVAPGEAVLNAALRQGIPLQYGCRHGRCSSCKYMLVEGDVDFGNVSPYSLSERERDDGWALLCCAVPTSDLVIRDLNESALAFLPVIAPREQLASVRAVQPLGGNLWRLALDLDDAIEFYAGQFVEVGVPGAPGEWRSYSIASAPSDPDHLELVIKRIAGGAFSGRIDRIEVGSRLPLRGPYGTAYVRDGEGPLVLVATSSGIAPILSILRDAADTALARPLTFFYGVRTRSDLVLLDELERLQPELADFRFQPTLSAPSPQCRWEGSVGRVTHLIQRSIEDASPLEAHLCGAPAMCDSVGLLLLAKGTEEARIHYDRFYPALDP